MRALRGNPELTHRWLNFYDRYRYLKHLRGTTSRDIYTAKPFKIHYDDHSPRYYYDSKRSFEDYLDLCRHSPLTVAPYKYEFQRHYNTTEDIPYTYSVYYE